MKNVNEPYLYRDMDTSTQLLNLKMKCETVWFPISPLL